MSTLFLICATIGCTVLLLQLGLSLFGLVGDHTSLDLADPGDLGDLSEHPGGTAHDTLSGHSHATDSFADGQGADPHHGMQLARLITFQTVVAFLAFFGLGGLASLEAGRGPAAAVSIGILLGLGSMVILSYLLHGFRRLHQDGTVHPRRAIGRTGQVYLRVPASGGGEGKITVILQGRTVELNARSTGPAIPNNATVQIDDFFDNQTVYVSPIGEESPVVAASERK